MTRAAPGAFREGLQRFLPIALPIALLVIGYLWFVQPWIFAGVESRIEAQGLASRASSLDVLVKKTGMVEKAPPDETIQEFERMVPADSRVSDLVELIAKFALEPPNPDEARGLLVDAGQRVALHLAPAGAASQTGLADQGSDPRLALFAPIALESTPVTVSFEATYDRVGIFLWRLHELPTFADVRSLEVTRGLPLLKVKLVLLAYQRVGPAIVPGQAVPSQGQPARPKVADDPTSQTDAHLGTPARFDCAMRRAGTPALLWAGTPTPLRAGTPALLRAGTPTLLWAGMPVLTSLRSSRRIVGLP